MADFDAAAVERMLAFAAKREAIRLRREAGASAPWTDDEILAEWSFCNVHREHDRVTAWVRKHWREPHADDLDLFFAMAVARFVNWPDSLEAIGYPVPWNAEAFKNALREKQARGEKVFGAAYIIPASHDGSSTIDYVASILDELWSRREELRPRAGQTLEGCHNRLTSVSGVGSFIGAQILADTKQCQLKDAPDWWTFAASGPGSQRGLNRLLGRPAGKGNDWNEREWRQTLAQLQELITPALERLGIGRLCGQDVQNICCCEFDKYERARLGEGKPKRRYKKRPQDLPAEKKTRPKPKPKPAAATAPTPELLAERAAGAAQFVGTFAFLAKKYVIPAGPKKPGLRVAFDLESDGLGETATKVHCIVIADLDSDQVDAYGPDQIHAALEHLARASYITGHNIANFDLPLLQRLHGWAPATACEVCDTLVASRVILPHLDDLDDQAAAIAAVKSKFKGLGRLRGSHKLEAWGARLGQAKVGVDIDDWAQYRPEILERCISDTKLTRTLWRFLQPLGQNAEALALEHRAAEVCDRISADGVPFDVERAKHLCASWQARRDELGTHIKKQNPDLKNLNSRKELAGLLESRGWKPARRTEKTQAPCIDDEVLESIPKLYPEFSGLAEHDLLRRRIAQLSGGDKALLAHVGDDGRIHGGLVHIGTPHSRAKHLSPNIAATPNPKRGAPLSIEFRELFRHPGDWVFVAADQSNLQERGFAHYLAPYDGGAYAQDFIDGKDTHWITAGKLAFVGEDEKRDKANKLHAAIREGSKTFKYAFLYGAGPPRLGHIVSDTVRTVMNVEPSNDLRERIFKGEEHPHEGALKLVGKRMQDQFMQATPGLAQLREHLRMQYERHDWLPGLDNRRVPGGAGFKVLNRLITASEAILCKRWLVRTFDELRERFRYGWDGDVVLVLWIHDELVACCRPAIAAQVGEIMVRHAREAGMHFGLKLPLDASFSVGRDWAGTPVEVDEVDLVDEIGPEDALGSSLEHRVEEGIPDSDDENDGEELGEDEAEPDVGISSKPHAEREQVRVEAAHERPPPPPPPKEKPPKREAPRGGNGHSSWESFTDGNGKFTCPFHEEDNTPSLQIYDEPDNPHYHCFGCGAHGRFEDLPEELLEQVNGTQYRHEDPAKKLARAHALWDEAGPIGGTLAEDYLAYFRGIDIEALPADIDRTLRFHPDCPFPGHGNRPCLIALFRDIWTDEPSGIHRIALQPDGQKIDRAMLGSWPRPRSIKLWPLAGDRLFLGEGIETTLAGATWLKYHGVPLQPAWALGSAQNFLKFPILPTIEELLLLVDRDPIGEDNARACAEEWIAAGRRARRLRPQDPAINDFNDLTCAKVRACYGQGMAADRMGEGQPRSV
jgi:DNA polymerase I-like protein with 3'-5' exonuclease and polymerase domains